MQTCRDIIRSALKKLGIIRAGGQPKASDADDALLSLASFYMECITQGTFGRVFNVQMSQAGTVTAGGNQHFNILTEDVVTVDLPASLPANCWDNWRPCRDYGWGLNIPVAADENVVVPRDKSVVMVTSQYDATVRATYIYDSTVQQWLRIDTLDLNSEAPLSARSPDGLAAVLAMRIADEYGTPPTSLTVQAAGRYKTALVSNFGNSDCYC